MTTAGRPLDVINPATGAVAASYALATPADVDAAVAAARAAQPNWARATPAERATVLAQ
ncbi:MAG: aldehyde dehydrogenase family protein, partial [Actinobacteria bacterium]|nr:aldehyde dehydrogenase family protein [Actinomycetota bacterium]